MKVLILSMYYPPSANIASQRISAFEKYLKKNNIEVDVITRHYDEKQLDGSSMFISLEESNIEEDYIKLENVIYTNYSANNIYKSISEKLPPIIKGLYNFSKIDIFHHGWLDYVIKAYEEELADNNYDFIISSYGPPITILAGHTLSVKYNIPWIVDFRDLYITEKDSIQHQFLKKITIEKLLLKAKGFLFVSGGMRDYFISKVSDKVSLKPYCIVHNGIDINNNSFNSNTSDVEVKEKLEYIKSHSDITLLHTGTIYSGQNISFFTNNIERLSDELNIIISIVFVGLPDNNEHVNKGNNIYFLNRVSYNTSLQLQQKVDALLLPIWNGRYTGFSGKIYEYIYSNSIVLTSPNPQTDLIEFWNSFNNVITVNNYMHLKDIIKNIHSGSIPKQENKNVEKLKRSFYVEKLSIFLKKIKQLRHED